jgi:hypothetical protein
MGYAKLTGIINKSQAIFENFGVSIRLIKPILRPLSDMTEEESKEIGFWGVWHDVEFNALAWDDVHWSPEDFRILLSHHFDLFNLIPEGLAIDACTLKK